MTQLITLAKIDEITNFIRNKINIQPKIGIILGSGLGSLADRLDNATRIPYDQLPYWPISTVVGHQGQLVVGSLENQPVLIMQGRIHFYEGYDSTQITLPIRVMQRLGIQEVIITNAAGGINQSFKVGDIMLITDHINFVGMAGNTPLRGSNLDEFGPRFPDMSQAYDRELLGLARQVAQENEIVMREGVYVYLAGPSFETPAELRFLQTIGCDAVGMSTVPEVIIARHSGMRVLGLSSITNIASLDGNKAADHEEVLEAGRHVVPNLINLIRGILRKI